MPAKALKWTDPVNVADPISGVTVNDGAGALGTEYDNETNKHRWARFELEFQHGTGPTRGKQWKLFLLYAQDGTNYEDGSASVEPTKAHVLSAGARNVTTAQRVAMGYARIDPFKFKPLVWNDTGQNSSANSVTLHVEVFDEELQ